MAVKGKLSMEQQRQLARQRQAVLHEFAQDPWLGYESIEDALNDYKCTTQAEALARILSRENVFISGPAGSGKSTLINRFIKLIDAEFSGQFDVALTASTGIAATVISGSTIHSWAGLGIDTEPFDPKNISRSMLAKRKKMRSADVLVIDEISMLPAHLFTKLDEVLRYFRRCNEPFGGVQVILMGDFLQLPPVDRNDGVNANFAATTQAWKDLNLSYCYMDKTHRATDPRLAELLSKMSRDLVDEAAREMVRGRQGITPDPDKAYTTLFTTNRNVDRYNLEEQAKNQSPLVKIAARNTGPAKQVERLLKSNSIPDFVELKVGDTVLLNSNLNLNGEMLANGSIGKITQIRMGVPTVRFNNGRSFVIDRKVYAATEKRFYTDPDTGKEMSYEFEVARVEQVPLKLGYAITVHKSQGQTFDGVIVDLSKCFTPGLGYVALSRVRSLDDLIVTGLSSSAFDIDPKSKVLSNFVKKKALRGRGQFIAKLAEYSPVLSSNLYRAMFWDETESSAQRMEKK